MVDEEQLMRENQQVQDFVHKMSQEPAFYEQVLADPDTAFAQLGFGELVARVLKAGLLVFADKAALPPQWQHFVGIVSPEAGSSSASWWI